MIGASPPNPNFTQQITPSETRSIREQYSSVSKIHVCCFGSPPVLSELEPDDEATSPVVVLPPTDVLESTEPVLDSNEPVLDAVSSVETPPPVVTGSMVVSGARPVLVTPPADVDPWTVSVPAELSDEPPSPPDAERPNPGPHPGARLSSIAMRIHSSRIATHTRYLSVVSAVK
jgi:hypothetical protein